MTIDERIEKLAATIADAHAKSIERMTRIEESQAKSNERMTRLEEAQAKTQTILADVLDSIKRLERIALAHEVRIDDIDASLSKLEARRPQ